MANALHPKRYKSSDMYHGILYPRVIDISAMLCICSKVLSCQLAMPLATTVNGLDVTFLCSY